MHYSNRVELDAALRWLTSGQVTPRQETGVTHRTLVRCLTFLVTFVNKDRCTMREGRVKQVGADYCLLSPLASDTPTPQLFVDIVRGERLG